MSEYTINEVTTLASTAKRNYSKLPVIDFFRVNIAGVTGTASDRRVTRYEILVQTHGNGELRNAADVAAQYGMKLPHNNYKTREAAFAEALEFKNKWGKSTSKAGKKTDAKVEEAVKGALAVALNNLVKNGIPEAMAKTILGIAD